MIKRLSWLAALLVGCALSSTPAGAPSVSRECVAVDERISCASPATLTGHDAGAYEIAITAPRRITSCEGPPYPSMCALDVGGHVWCWDGPAADGLTCESVRHDETPSLLPLTEPVIEFAGCRRHGCGLRDDGRVECIEMPEVAIDSSTWTCDAVQYIVEVPPIVDLVTANCGRTRTGRLFCWGAWTSVDQFFGTTQSTDVHRTYEPATREYPELAGATAIAVAGRLWDPASRDAWLGCVATTERVTCRDVHGSRVDAGTSVAAICPIADFVVLLDSSGAVRILSTAAGAAPWPGQSLTELDAPVLALGGPEFASDEPGPCGVLESDRTLNAIWSRGPSLSDLVIRSVVLE